MTRCQRRFAAKVGWIFAYLRDFVRARDASFEMKWQQLVNKLAQYPDTPDWPDE